MSARQALIAKAMEAAGELMQDMTAEVCATDAEAGRALTQGLTAGARPVLVLEFSETHPKIRLCLADDYESLRQVMTIEAKQVTRQ